jgi:hypothetical protein
MPPNRLTTIKPRRCRRRRREHTVTVYDGDAPIEGSHATVEIGHLSLVPHCRITLFWIKAPRKRGAVVTGVRRRCLLSDVPGTRALRLRRRRGPGVRKAPCGRSRPDTYAAGDQSNQRRRALADPSDEARTESDTERPPAPGLPAPAPGAIRTDSGSASVADRPHRPIGGLYRPRSR